jgi:hypothetical protein
VKNLIEKAKRVVILHGNKKVESRIQVRSRDIDAMGHLNNNVKRSDAE